MQIVNGRLDGAPSERRGPTFTGVVYADPVLPTTDGVTVNAVTFTPGARTYWHRHQHGQLLQVTMGLGLVCSAGGPARAIRAGDLVWVPPGERHWHGGTSTTCMAHTAISLGATQWFDPVDPADYDDACATVTG